MENIDKFIGEYQTKYKEGFTRDEIDKILDLYDISSDVFFKSMFGNTYMIIDGNAVYYHTDIRKSLCSILNNK